MTFPSTSRSQGQVEIRPSAALAASLLGQAFLWMFAGLLLTAGVAFVVQTSPAVMATVAGAWLPIVLGQLALAWAIGLGIRRMSATLALGLFFVYAATLGFTIGVIVSLYTGESVFTAFLSAAAMFGGAGLYGVTTKRSLVGLGGVLTIGLFGLIAASIVNLFLPNGAFGWIIALVPEGWARLFTNDPEVIAATVAYITRVAPFYCLFGVGMTLSFASQGANRMAAPFLAGVTRLFVATLGGWFAIESLGWGLEGVFTAIAVGMVAFGILIAWPLLVHPWRGRA